ncbi:MAG TPA: hypothetical protein VGN82_20125 [Bosea sp. (in: a-proteobacteria)]|uniref:hypothetical protein n=1 Tax=Bosea sp. (in: a-proteobacteria) TaxID=1871050 RepID=UPI002E125615|nr:hypothetical protein [Bosea sp. (in: a-proteobacteria)]
MLPGVTKRPDDLLDAGETLIWWGSPEPRRFAMRGAAIKVPFMLFFVGFSIFWMIGAAKAGGFVWTFGLLFFGVGLWGLGEPLRRYRDASGMRYVVTDQRTIVAAPGWQKSFLIRTLPFIEVNASKPPLGDVLFFNVEISNSEGPNTIERDGFIGIPEAEAVAREMRRLQAAAP